MKSAEDLLRYYSGEGCDGGGRSLAEVQGWPDGSLERVHDFIQWMFPLGERSAFNPDAPVLDGTAMAQFLSSPKLRAALHVSFARMLDFYGLEIRESPSMRIIPSAAFRRRSSEWVTPRNHNYLRITRILKSLSILGLKEEANQFFECLSNIYDSQDKRNPPIPLETLRYWKAAIAENIE
jgi:Opioid growth factor receptor (OGFr) conserved region